MATPASIHDLPAEMACEVFKYLNLEELINCKLLAKPYYEIVSKLMKVKKLQITQKKSLSIENCHPNLFIAQFKSPFLSNLKCLTIHRLLNIDLNSLKHFTPIGKAGD